MGAKAPIVKLFRFDPPQDSEITQKLAIFGNNFHDGSLHCDENRFFDEG